MVDGRATAYVCENFTCQAPTNELQKLLEQLGLAEDPAEGDTEGDTEGDSEGDEEE